MHSCIYIRIISFLFNINSMNHRVELIFVSQIAIDPSMYTLLYLEACWRWGGGPGSQGPWAPGPQGPRVPGSLGPRVPGSLAPGPQGPWALGPDDNAEEAPLSIDIFTYIDLNPSNNRENYRIGNTQKSKIQATTQRRDHTRIKIIETTQTNTIYYDFKRHAPKVYESPNGLDTNKPRQDKAKWRKMTGINEPNTIHVTKLYESPSG